jgi:DNA polymerase I-like protein with 3'-5' exonuclease and polymerase domains
MRINTTLVSDFETFKKLQEHSVSSAFSILTLDTETDGVNECTANLYGVSLCYSPFKTFYIPIRKQGGDKWWSLEQEDEIRDWVISECKRLKLIGHNLIYDVLVLERNWGYDLTPHIYSDTILLKHMVDEERPFALKEIAVKYLGSESDNAQKELYANIEKNGGLTTQKNMEMFKADTEVLAVYACHDVSLTRQLFDIFEERLFEEDLGKLFYEDEVMPLYREVTIPMKRRGFPVDVAHFDKLLSDITTDINSLEDKVQMQLKTLSAPFCTELLKKEYPCKNKGTFPKVLAEVIGFELPLKDGKITLARKEIDKLIPQTEQHKNFIAWIKDDKTIPLDDKLIRQVQELRFYKDNCDSKYIFNLQSNNHLKWLFFEKLKETPLSFTDETNQPQVDEDFLDSIDGKHAWLEDLVTYKKLIKLKSTYIEGILSRHTDGIIHTSMLQFGTTSGRYASRNPNLNNLPAQVKPGSLVARYTNAIRQGMVAPKGYKMVGSDFNSLEPHIAAYASQDPELMDIFVKGKDFYSAIGARQFNIDDATLYKDDSANSFAVKYKDLRDKIKTYALAAFYGASPFQIAYILKCDIQEATSLLEGYFDAYPMVRDFIDKSHRSATIQGHVQTKFGRIRHLPKVKRLHKLHGERLLNWQWAKERGLTDVRGEYKNQLNNAVNFQIQGLAAHCLNRAMIKISRELKEKNLDAYICLAIHDEILVICKVGLENEVAGIVKHGMETCVDISPIKLGASPVIGNNYAECK